MPSGESPVCVRRYERVSVLGTRIDFTEMHLVNSCILSIIVSSRKEIIRLWPATPALIAALKCIPEGTSTPISLGDVEKMVGYRTMIMVDRHGAGSSK